MIVYTPGSDWFCYNTVHTDINFEEEVFSGVSKGRLVRDQCVQTLSVVILSYFVSLSTSVTMRLGVNPNNGQVVIVSDLLRLRPSRRRRVLRNLERTFKKVRDGVRRFIDFTETETFLLH